MLLGSFNVPAWLLLVLLLLLLLKLLLLLLLPAGPTGLQAKDVDILITNTSILLPDPLHCLHVHQHVQAA